MLDFERIAEVRDAESQSDLIKTMLDPNDPPYLSDVVIRAGGHGQPVLIELADMESEAKDDRVTPMLWKLFCIRDKWGNAVEPGDVVKKINKKPLVKNGRVVSSGDINVAMMDGSYEEKYLRIKDYPVDEKGCIECSFTDAVHFLNTNGIHGKTNRTMIRSREFSDEPVNAPNGQKLHAWNWLFKEVDAATYAALPKLENTKRPKRGIDEPEKLKAWDKKHDDKLAADDPAPANAATGIR